MKSRKKKEKNILNNEEWKQIIERYPFGPEGNISLKAAARRSAIEKPRIEVDSNIPFKLVVRYGDKEETYQVAAGKSNY